MDLAEIMLIGMDRSSLKREEQWFFLKNPPVLHPVRAV
jgi:hypothetical protein